MATRGVLRRAAASMGGGGSPTTAKSPPMAPNPMGRTNANAVAARSDSQPEPQPPYAQQNINGGMVGGDRWARAKASAKARTKGKWS